MIELFKSTANSIFKLLTLCWVFSDLVKIDWSWPCGYPTCARDSHYRVRLDMLSSSIGSNNEQNQEMH